MFLKTNIPETTLGLAGSGVAFRDLDVHGLILAHDNNKMQALYGNRCGHNPTLPRNFMEPIHHKKRIPLLESAKHRIGEAYKNPLKYDVAPLFYHQDKQNKDGSYRKLRSEAKEMATTLFGKALFHIVNLGGMILGTFNEKEKRFIYYDLNYIASITNTSLKRVYRIAKLFKKLGYISIEQRWKREADGTYTSLAPIIRVSKKIFIDLGFAPEQIAFHCGRAEKELEKKEKRAAFSNDLITTEIKKPKIESSDRRIAQQSIKAIIKGLTGKLIRPNTS